MVVDKPFRAKRCLSLRTLTVLALLLRKKKPPNAVSHQSTVQCVGAFKGAKKKIAPVKISEAVQNARLPRKVG